MKNIVLAFSLILTSCVVPFSQESSLEESSNDPQEYSIIDPGDSNTTPTDFSECSHYPEYKAIPLSDGSFIYVPVVYLCNPYAYLFFVPDDPAMVDKNTYDPEPDDETNVIEVENVIQY